MAKIANKKLFWSILGVSLALILTASVLLGIFVFARKEKNVKINYEGTHIMNASDTDKFLAENGYSEYTVVYPENPTSIERSAKTEFIYLFEEATNIKLREIRDTGLVHNDSSKYISIGNTELLKSSGIKVDQDILKDDGCRVVTKGNNIYIFGGNRNGTLYGVYDFMQITFDFDTFYSDYFEINRNVSDVKLKNYDVLDLPDFQFRAASNGILETKTGDYDSSMYGDRFRENGSRSTNFIPMHKSFDVNSNSKKTTNCDTILPKNTYASIHPDWFSDNGNQWCYTAHGNEEELELMIEEVCKKIEFSLQIYTPEKYPHWNLVGILHEDNSDYCTCETCNESITKYGSITGAMIQFLNRVGEKIDAWMAKEENQDFKRDDLRIVMFAYNFSTIAPAVKDKNGTWNPIDESVVLNDRCGIYFAPNNIFFNYSIYDEQNQAGKENIDAWSALTDCILYWVYTVNYKNFFYPVDSSNFLNSETLSYLAAKSSRFYCNNGIMPQSGTVTAWQNLTAYVESKLLWDTSLNEAELMDKWFQAAFCDSEVISIMKQLYYDMKAHAKQVFMKNGWDTSAATGAVLADKTLWPLATLMQWKNSCDLAIEKLEKYKHIDKNIYDQVYKHIEIECISPMYIMLELHYNNLSATDREEIISRLTEDMNRYGLQKMRKTENGGYLEDFLLGLN